MKVLIVGNGGREHALAWKAAQSPQVSEVLVAPGNAGTACEARVKNIDIDASDVEKLLRFCQNEKIDLTIVGPEKPLSLGIVDAFQKAGLRCFGPTQHAAQLESSKVFSKAFMKRHGIPTATYETFNSLSAATLYLQQQKLPIVIKADGLAAGKGVIIALTQKEAIDGAEHLLKQHPEIVIEEYLEGEEASFMVIADGMNIVPLATSQDHKRRNDGDTGPNTGGMGAYSPAPIVSPALHARVIKEIIMPTLSGMAQEGHYYRGFLYAGLMIQPDGTPKVLEFNCRLGDPEAEVILMRLKSDIVTLCFNVVENQLSADQVIEWDTRPALGVVLTAGTYPESSQSGIVINHIPDTSNVASNLKIFHAGTAMTEDQTIVLQGGRILCVTALGDTIRQAKQYAYEIAKQIQWDGIYYRHDIGERAIARGL